MDYQRPEKQIMQHTEFKMQIDYLINGDFHVLFVYAMIIPYMHVVMTSSNGIIFHDAGTLCGEFIDSGVFSSCRPVRRNFDVVFFYLHLNKQLSNYLTRW